MTDVVVDFGIAVGDTLIDVPQVIQGVGENRPEACRESLILRQLRQVADQHRRDAAQPRRPWLQRNLPAVGRPSPNLPQLYFSQLFSIVTAISSEIAYTNISDA